MTSGGAKPQNRFLFDNHLDSSSQIFLNNLTTPLSPQVLRLKEEEINTKDMSRARHGGCRCAYPHHRGRFARHAANDHSRH